MVSKYNFPLKAFFGIMTNFRTEAEKVQNETGTYCLSKVKGSYQGWYYYGENKFRVKDTY